MVILSKKSNITLSIVIRSEYATERMSVEVTNDYVIFRARSCRAEVSLNQAKHYPSHMSSCVKGLIPDVYQSELDVLIRELIKVVNGA
ncbi:hypothetical protein CkP1_0065 [Citrobacter phage CkP1]|nr:hypothetical protein CkP1_0065 [Citrobacter phage CkP1]